EEAPYGDPSWELWGMNNLHLMPDIDPTKFSRWYNLHDLTHLADPNHKDGDVEHHAWLQSWTGCPVYIMDPFEGVETDVDGTPLPTLAQRTGYPAAVPFPKAQIIPRFPRYFTNTVSWQIAHAIYEAMTEEVL